MQDPTDTTPSANERPLHGVRVLEIAHFAVGPFASMLLADWGADVVKVEPPGGEAIRNWPPLVDSGGEPPYGMNFAALNRNKRSVCIDLKTEEGRERARRLAAQADILIENYRPGVLDKLGLGYERLSQDNPRLVYCSITGYGQSGPFRDKGAFDIAVQGMSGIMSVTGETDGPPAKSGLPIADYGSAVFAAMSCMVSLRQAERTGRGTHLDVPMLSCMLALSCLHTSEFWGSGTVPRRLGSRHPTNAPYQAFSGSDGKWFIVAAGSDRLWERVLDVLDAVGLRQDARFATPSGRAEHQVELAAALQARFSHKDAATWLKVLDDAQIPCAPVLDYAEALASPHVVQTGLVHQMELPGGRTVPTIGNPVRMAGYDFDVFRGPPRAGEHDREVDTDWLREHAGA
jgi:succinate--hydroxymethylglutarate CoA-transferase